MKKQFIYICLFALSLAGCKKSELQPYIGGAGINFEKVSNLYNYTYSFIGNTSNEATREFIVNVSGDSASFDRNFEVEVVNDSNTTALPAQYEVLSATVKKGEFKGKLVVKLLRTAELDNKTIGVKFRIKNSKDFNVGEVEASEFIVKWTNQVVLPSWTYFGIFFCNASSNAAYKLIVETTGLTTLIASEYSKIGEAGVVAMATVFGDYIKQWNKDHPNDKKKHDTGTKAGQDIEPVHYTRSKFD